MSDQEILGTVYNRYARNPDVDVNYPDKIIIALEKEIMGYREKINNMERVFDAQNRIVAKLKRCSCTNDPTTCEAVQQSAAAGEIMAGEIIKALADNGYDTITINCYKDIEKERENDA